MHTVIAHEYFRGGRVILQKVSHDEMASFNSLNHLIVSDFLIGVLVPDLCQIWLQILATPRVEYLLSVR